MVRDVFSARGTTVTAAVPLKSLLSTLSPHTRPHGAALGWSHIQTVRRARWSVCLGGREAGCHQKKKKLGLLGKRAAGS